MDEKKNSEETLDGVKTGTEKGAGKLEDLVVDVDALADQAVADASEKKAAAEASTGAASETVKDAAAEASTGSASETVKDAAADASTGSASGTVKDAAADASTGSVSGTVKDAATDASTGSVSGTVKDAATDASTGSVSDSAKSATTAVNEEAAQKKPMAKVDPRYDKIFWPTAGRVWSNTLTVIIVAALMAGTIFLVDLGLRAIIDGFMSI